MQPQDPEWAKRSLHHNLQRLPDSWSEKRLHSVSLKNRCMNVLIRSSWSSVSKLFTSALVLSCSEWFPARPKRQLRCAHPRCLWSCSCLALQIHGKSLSTCKVLEFLPPPIWPPTMPRPQLWKRVQKRNVEIQGAEPETAIGRPARDMQFETSREENHAKAGT